jgi:hypothetical protein
VSQSTGVRQMRSNLAVLSDSHASLYEKQTLLETRAKEIEKEALLSRADYTG